MRHLKSYVVEAWETKWHTGQVNVEPDDRQICEEYALFSTRVLVISSLSFTQAINRSPHLVGVCRSSPTFINQSTVTSLPLREPSSRQRSDLV